MSYKLYVLRQGAVPSSLLKSHWALLILIQGNALGTYVHVTGSAYAGFTFEIKRNWNQATADETFRFILIGQVPETSIVLQPPIIDYMIDDTARSPLEMALLTEPAPGKSLKVRPLTLKDCQWWIRQALPHVVAQGHVKIFEGADQALAEYCQ